MSGPAALINRIRLYAKARYSELGYDDEQAGTNSMVKKVTELVEVSYWDCGRGHRHKTQEIAQQCLRRFTALENRKLDRISPDKLEIGHRILNGERSFIIAKEFGISSSTVATYAIKALE